MLLPTKVFGQALPEVVVDTFSRSDGPLGSAESGQNWIVHSGVPSVDAGAARFGAGFDLASLESGTSEGSVEVQVAAPADEFWLVVRLSDPANYWRFGRWQGGAYQLQQVVENALGSPQVTTTESVQAQTGDTLRCSLHSSGISCSVNGTLVASTSDTFGFTATRVGISGYAATSGRLDNFRVFGPALVAEISVGLSGPLSAYTGGSVNWTATIQNIGALAASGIELRIQPPAGQANLVIEGPTCTFDGSIYRCPISSLAPQATAFATVRLISILPTTILTLTATVPTVAGETDTSNNTASFSTTIRQPIPPDALIVDTFDRPDSLGLGSATSGQSWTQHSGQTTIQSGQAAAGSGFSLSSIDTGSTTNVASVILTQPGNEFWLVMRFENSTNYWRFGRWPQQAYELQQIVNNGIGSSAITTLATVMPAAGDVLSCDNWSSLLECSVNGVPVVRTTSTEFSSARRVGLSTYQEGARFDDFVVTGPPPVPDLVTTLSGPVTTTAGSLASWTASVHNESVVEVQSVELTITATSIGDPSFSGASCVSTGTGWRCSLGTLAAGQTVAVGMAAMAPSFGSVLVSATVPAQFSEVALSNNTASFSTTIRQPIPPDALIVDTFDRPDSLGLGSATSGQSWTQHSGQTTIQSGQAAAGSGFSLSSIDTGSATNAASVILTQPANEFWLVTRFEDSTNYWRFGRRQQEAYQLQQIVNNSFGSPAITTLATVMPAAGDVLRCDNWSSLLECSVNGVPVVRTTSTEFSSARRVGLSTYQAGARFDDLVVTGPPPVPDLVTTLSGPVTTTAGSLASWTASVHNDSVVEVQSVELTITATSIGDPSFSGASCVSTGTGWRCSLGALAPGQTVAVGMAAVAPSFGSVQVSATVPAQFSEVALSNNTASFSTTIRQPIPPDALIVDTFDRPDSLVLGSATSGQSWTQHSGQTTIQSGQAAAGSGFSLSSIDTGSATNATSVILTQPGNEFWLVTRFEDSTNYWRFGRWQQEAYQLQQIVDNSLGSSAITTLATVMPAAGDVLSCDTWSSVLECSVNGVPVVRTTSPEFSNATRVGLSTYQAGARFDDLVVTGPPPVPDLVTTLSGPVTATAGSLASWTASVHNDSVVEVQSVELTITATSIGDPSFSGASCVSTGTGWRCSLGALAPGQTVAVGMAAMAPSFGSVQVSATVPAQSSEVAISNNTASFSTTIRQPIPPDAVLIDTFDRPDSSGLGVATSGQSWSSHYSFIDIVAGQGVPRSGFTLWSVDTGTPVYDAYVSVTSLAPEFWLVLRLQDSQNYWRFGRWQGSQYQLQLISGGILVDPVVQTLVAVTPAAGDFLGCSVGATGITCSVNGVNVVSTADTAGQTSTRVGLSAYNGNQARFEDLFAVGPPPAPNIAVSVVTPRFAAVGSTFPLEVVAKNNGNAPSVGGSVLVSLSSAVTVISQPTECVLQSSSSLCSLSGLASSGSSKLTFSLRIDSRDSFTGSATATVAGDSFPVDNSASWTTSGLPTGSVLEDFERADTTSGLGTSPSMHNWIAATPGFRIENGVARADSAGAMSFLNTAHSFGTMEIVLGDSAMTTGIVFRVVDQNNYFRLAADASGYYALRKVINGVVQNPQFLIVRESLRPSSGDVVRVITRPDDGMFVSVNGRQVLDAGDLALMYEKGWGLASVGGPASALDFYVNPRIEAGLSTVDNFQRPDQYPLGQPTSGVNYRWRNWFGPPWIIVSGVARPVYSGYGLTWIDSGSEQTTAEVKVVQQGQGAWLVFRMDEFQDTHFRFGQDSGTYMVEYVQGSSVVAMPASVQTLTSPTPQDGDVLRVAQETDGTVECFVNGVLTHRFIDNSTNFRWTLNGLASEGTQAAFDDFRMIP